MSRSVSTFAVAIILFVVFLATFSSAAPADVARGELGVQRRHNHVKDTPSQVDNTTDSTTSTDTTVTDDTNSGSSSGTYTGQVRRFDDRRSIIGILIALLFIRAVMLQATYFTPGLGACGEYNTASDSIVALASANYAQSYCDKV